MAELAIVAFSSVVFSILWFRFVLWAERRFAVKLDERMRLQRGTISGYCESMWGAVPWPWRPRRKEG